MFKELLSCLFDNEILIIVEKDIGEYRITKKALADIMNKSTADISGLKGLKWEMKQVEDVVEITVFCQLEDNAPAQEITEIVPKRLKWNIQEWVGIEIKEVNVLIRS
ncbi:hypothetical protein Sgly_1907 [Syntrophobotulus glycolicus DSM 8271]|uniref:Asp23/Gls24 family envelope stress response protein n=1 Tax=Syntrophobotulus glycolicus (strain DSM 8271 / FlGlyR) TaxID=645991 RepID=F0T0R4_SYNGF|nr:hypothetical protein [Syntrophobotulus glycolicus]ADY56203.1 hypothetical protein Sgly_1907 [Syntrophobotulus glycolicus DSM 8271]